MTSIGSIISAIGKILGVPKQIGEETFKEHRRSTRDPLTRSGVCYVPMEGFEHTRHYRDKQNLHHLGRYEWAVRVLGKLPARGTVLDCASGAGYGSLKLAEIFQKVDAVDRFPEAIEMGRDRYDDPKIDWHCLDVAKLRSVFSEGSFDAIVCMQTIEFVEEDHRFLDDLESLLKPGGVLLIDTPVRSHRVDRPENPHHKRYYGVDEWLEMLQSRFEIAAFRSLPEADFLQRCQMPSEGSIVYCTKIKSEISTED